MNDKTRNFFSEHGRLLDKDSNPGPHVQIFGDFAVDTQSQLAWSRAGWIRLGQNIQTKEFIAFKPLVELESDEIAEVKWLRGFKMYKGSIKHFGDRASRFKNANLYFVGMDLVDGVTFKHLNDLLPKINIHARYLIIYNLIKTLEDFQKRSISQKDMNPGNVMICFNFDVKIIDFGDLQNVVPYSINTKLFNQIFSDGPLSRFGSSSGNTRKYSHGTFENLLKYIADEDELENNNSIRCPENYPISEFINRLPRFGGYGHGWCCIF